MKKEKSAFGIKYWLITTIKLNGKKGEERRKWKKKSVITHMI